MKVQPGTFAALSRSWLPMRALGCALILVALSLWGVTLYATLAQTVDRRVGAAEALARAAREDARTLLAAREADRRGNALADAARRAALAAEGAEGAPGGTRLAEALNEADGPAARKEAFITLVLPLILAENSRILAERARLERLQAELDRAAGTLAEADRTWLKAMAVDFEVDEDDDPRAAIQALLILVDIVPPSMALAQAAEESGWGTSRPAQGQNALFGLQTIAIGGLVSAPVAVRDGRLKNASFEHLRQGVAVYMHTLNTNKAYGAFRAAREERRRAGKPLLGVELVTHLTRYSELGMTYIRKIQALIRANGLASLDRVPGKAAALP